MPFWGTRSRFPWAYINNQNSSTTKEQIASFLGILNFPRSEKELQRSIGLLTYYRNYIPRLAERLIPFFQLLKATEVKAKIPITSDIMKKFRMLNEALDRCCQLALRQPLPGKQLVLMTDAIFQAAGYAVLIEDDPDQKYNSTSKTYARIAYASKTYTPSQIKTSIYAKEFLAIHLVFKDFGLIFYGATKLVIIITHSKLITRFFQTKMIPPPSWNAFDFVLQFNFTIERISGKMNTAEFFLTRLEIDPNEKILPNNSEDIPTEPFEVNIETLVFIWSTLETWKRKKRRHTSRSTSDHSVVLLPKWPTQRHTNCEHRTISQTIAYRVYL